MKHMHQFIPGNLPKYFLGPLAAVLLLNGCATAHVAKEKSAISDAEIRDVITRVAKHQIHALADGDYAAVKSVEEAKAAKAPEGLAWSYPWGVTLFGMLRSTDVTGDKAVDKFVVEHDLACARYYSWLAGLKASVTNGADLNAFTRGSKIRGLISLGNLDSCGSMGNQILESMIRHPESVTPEEKAVVERIAEWVVKKQERLPDGTFWRPKSMGGTLWPDDLYMGGVFLVRWGVYNHDQKFIEDAANNIINQAAKEADTDGIWFHGYFEDKKQHAPFKWGRGNGWVTVTLVETLSALDEKSPLRPKLIEILKAQIEGLKKVQAPSGMWRQVLDKPELWEETSCTAMFAYGIARAVNRGWIDASNMEVARKAFAGIATHVTADGSVNGTCLGTNIGEDLDYYIKRTQPDDDLHGRGVVLLAGTELLLAGKK
ncbi:MAG TPA: glycoside hydrolase family 88 protein [Candidatus Acidoferrales bacterium]|jgi:unsaturated rhamnogalacturonyl hydrolase|nr:glycoside hydrolase family 88 protein [Candidatus Acidoferrales bacterium]